MKSQQTIWQMETITGSLILEIPNFVIQIQPK